LARSKKVDVIICLGCLVKGETMHFEYIAQGVSQGIARLNSTGNVPVIFGVLTCLTEQQALDRSVGPKNEGYGWGMAAVEMGLLE
jgi:6,7-dimethyl-8-ribityllumazine synthase